MLLLRDWCSLVRAKRGWAGTLAGTLSLLCFSGDCSRPRVHWPRLPRRCPALSGPVCHGVAPRSLAPSATALPRAPWPRLSRRLSHSKGVRIATDVQFGLSGNLFWFFLGRIEFCCKQTVNLKNLTHHTLAESMLSVCSVAGTDSF